MSNSRAFQVMDAHWGRMYQAPEAFPVPGVFVSEERDPLDDGIPRIHLLRRGSTLLGLAPAGLVPVVSALAERLGPTVETEAWSAFDVCRIEQMIGPAWIGVAGRSDFVPDREAAQVRQLTRGDAAALGALRDAVDPTEWIHGAMDEEQKVRFGYFEGGSLLAAAGYQVWGNAIAHLCVVADSRHRGQGHGRAVVSAAAGHALGRGLVAQYRTLGANLASRAIARRLGFVDYGETLTLRLMGGGTHGHTD